MKKEIKDETIFARITSTQKETIMNKARDKNMSLSEYVTECTLAPTERRSTKYKSAYRKGIIVTEKINETLSWLKEYQGTFPDEIYYQLIDKLEHIEVMLQ